jgi:hypothetical protein
MRRRALLIGAAGVLAGASAAWALKMEVQMTPRNLASEGFKVKTEREGEDVKFVIERDLRKSTWPGRSGSLSLPGEDGKPKNSRIKPSEKDGIQAYQFSVPAKAVGSATFTIMELRTAANNPNGLELVGGGTYYRFRLADYTRPR